MKRSQVLVTMAVITAIVMSGCAVLDKLAGKTDVSEGDSNMGLPEYKGVKHAIGCKNFANQAGWSGSWDIGNNLSIMLESALYDTGRFVMVEREQLSDVLVEQDLNAGGRTAGAKNVAKTGLLRPAKYLATGALIEASEDTSGGRGGVSFKGISLGGGKSKARVKIVAKLVDTTTGQVMKKKEFVGVAGKANMSVGLRYKGLGTEVGGFKKTPLGEAAQDCIIQYAKWLALEIEKEKFDAAVVKVDRDGMVIINRGAEHALPVGKEMVMCEEGELLLDPGTGEVLGREKGKDLGQLKVERVDEKISYCSVTSGMKKPAPGTLVLEK